MPSAPAQRVQFQYQVPSPPPRVHPKEDNPSVDPVARRTRSDTKTVEQPVDQSMMYQLKQALMVTPSQDYQHYFPKSILYLFTTAVTALAMPVLDAEMVESLEYRQIRCNTRYQNI